jgi:hypothetical protein
MEIGMQNCGILPFIAATLFCLAQTREDLSHWATVESHVKGEPVYAFGYTYVYAVSRDFHHNVIAQEGNSAPAQKIRPNKSWQIASVVLAGHPEGMGRADPRTGSVEVGQAFPRELEIRTSRDAYRFLEAGHCR